MKENHILALFFAYYLARFNLQAYSHLGYSTMLGVHKGIGKILQVNSHTVKQLRDGFDPLFGHRVGYYQVPLTKSSVQVAQALQDLDEYGVYNIVKEFLEAAAEGRRIENGQIACVIITEKKKSSTVSYVLRTAAGKRWKNFSYNTL